jgi:hypothetical protein
VLYDLPEYSVLCGRWRDSRARQASCAVRVRIRIRAQVYSSYGIQVYINHMQHDLLTHRKNTDIIARFIAVTEFFNTQSLHNVPILWNHFQIITYIENSMLQSFQHIVPILTTALFFACCFQLTSLFSSSREYGERAGSMSVEVLWGACTRGVYSRKSFAYKNARTSFQIHYSQTYSQPAFIQHQAVEVNKSC